MLELPTTLTEQVIIMSGSPNKDKPIKKTTTKKSSQRKVKQSSHNKTKGSKRK